MLGRKVQEAGQGWLHGVFSRIQGYGLGAWAHPTIQFYKCNKAVGRPQLEPRPSQASEVLYRGSLRLLYTILIVHLFCVDIYTMNV